MLKSVWRMQQIDSCSTNVSSFPLSAEFPLRAVTQEGLVTGAEVSGVPRQTASLDRDPGLIGGIDDIWVPTPHPHGFSSWLTHNHKVSDMPGLIARRSVLVLHGVRVDGSGPVWHSALLTVTCCMCAEAARE